MLVYSSSSRISQWRFSTNCSYNNTVCTGSFFIPGTRWICEVFGPVSRGLLLMNPISITGLKVVQRYLIEMGMGAYLNMPKQISTCWFRLPTLCIPSWLVCWFSGLFSLLVPATATRACPFFFALSPFLIIRGFRCTFHHFSWV